MRTYGREGGEVHGDTYTATGKATARATAVIEEDMVGDKVNLTLTGSTGSEVVTGRTGGALGKENSPEHSTMEGCGHDSEPRPCNSPQEL